MREGVLHHFPSRPWRAESHFDSELLPASHGAVQLEESRKNVRPLAVLEQREALTGERLDDFSAFFTMLLVHDRFFAQSWQTGLQCRAQRLEMEFGRRSNNQRSQSAGTKCHRTSKRLYLMSELPTDGLCIRRCPVE